MLNCFCECFYFEGTIAAKMNDEQSSSVSPDTSHSGIRCFGDDVLAFLHLR